MKGTNIGEFEEIVLLMVSILEDEAYVLRMKQEMYIQVKRSVSMGALHSTLSRLERKGYLISRLAGASAKRGGRRKRVYQMTALGTKVLQEVKDMRGMLWSQVPSYTLSKSNA